MLNATSAAASVVDIAFRLSGGTLPWEHAYALSQAVQSCLPWLRYEQYAGVHLIHGAESGNGWLRPDGTQGGLLHLSRRTRLTLRVPGARTGDARVLTGSTLRVGAHRLQVGEGTLRPMHPMRTLFARYVFEDEHDAEDRFVARVLAWLGDLDIPDKQLICGKAHVISIASRAIRTRSVLVADLSPAQSIRLQQQGLGPYRKLGCGLFMPHKGIYAIRELDET